MPKKRRNKKNKKCCINNKQNKNEAGTADTPLKKCDNTTVPPSISITNVLTPTKAIPSPKVNNNVVQFHRNNEIALSSTPVNREKSFRRSRIKEQNTPNFSNINLLFNLENSCNPIEIVPTKINVGTQTVYSNPVITCDAAVQFEEVKYEQNMITETPKISQLQLLDGLDINYQKSHSFEEKLLQKTNTLLRGFNVNPYLKTNVEAAETSFFTSHFYNLKTVSTPIERANYLGKQRHLSPKNDVHALKNEILALKRCYKSVSPKINRYTNHTKFCNKSHNISLLKQKSPVKNNLSAICKRISVQEDVTQTFVESSVGARLFSNVKHLGRFTAKWTIRFIQLCWELGITIRKVSTYILLINKM